MTNIEQTIDKHVFIQRLFSAISLVDDTSDSSLSIIDVATNQRIDPLIYPLLQQQVINTNMTLFFQLFLYCSNNNF